MLFRFPTFIAILVSAQDALSATNNFSLYAYGENVPTGMKPFHADGEPYTHRYYKSNYTAQAKHTLGIQLHSLRLMLSM